MFTWNHHQNFALICPYPALQICLHGIAIRILPLFALIQPYRYVYMESPSEFLPYLPLSDLTDMFTLNHHQNFTLIHPYPTCRHIYMESPSEICPYLPLSHLQICLHWIFIRTSPLFALIPPADMFTWNRHQNFTLIHPYLALQTYLHWIAIRTSPLFTLIWPYRYVYMESLPFIRPSENSPSVSFLPWLSSFLFLLASAIPQIFLAWSSTNYFQWV